LVVNGDAIILDTFNFEKELEVYERDVVHVWRSQNPINNLVYECGGVKLLPTESTIRMDTSKLDITTAISNKFKLVDEVSNVINFNSNMCSTWQFAFREGVKLISKFINKQEYNEVNHNLEVWCTVGADKLYGKYAIDGALAGKQYGEIYKDDVDALAKINDFSWLKGQFNKTYGNEYR